MIYLITAHRWMNVSPEIEWMEIILKCLLPCGWRVNSIVGKRIGWDADKSLCCSLKFHLKRRSENISSINWSDRSCELNAQQHSQQPLADWVPIGSPSPGSTNSSSVRTRIAFLSFSYSANASRSLVYYEHDQRSESHPLTPLFPPITYIIITTALR